MFVYIWTYNHVNPNNVFHSNSRFFFPVIVTFPLDEDPSVSIIAWTTTPWTLPSNLALCVHPDFTYVKVQGTDFSTCAHTPTYVMTLYHTNSFVLDDPLPYLLVCIVTMKKVHCHDEIKSRNYYCALHTFSNAHTCTSVSFRRGGALGLCLNLPVYMY